MKLDDPVAIDGMNEIEEERMMRVGNIMTPTPVTISQDSTLAEAAAAMLEARVSGLPVVGADGCIVGMITEGDLLRRAELGTAAPAAGWLAAFLSPGRAARDYVRTHGLKVRDVMTTTVLSTLPDASLASVVELMEANQVKRVPVIQDGKLVGIVSRADLLRALLQLLPGRQVAVVPDIELRKRVLAAFRSQPWAPCANVDATVKDGVVELRGAVTNDNERVGLRVIAENTPGIRAVQDRLVWVEPLSGTVIDIPKE